MAKKNKKGGSKMGTAGDSLPNAKEGSKAEDKVLKFSPLDERGSIAQATYMTVLEAICTEIQRTFNECAVDVVACLEGLTMITFPAPTLVNVY